MLERWTHNNEPLLIMPKTICFPTPTYGISWHLKTPAPGSLVPASGLHGNPHNNIHSHRHTYIHTYIHINKIIFKRNKKLNTKVSFFNFVDRWQFCIIYSFSKFHWFSQLILSFSKQEIILFRSTGNYKKLRLK